MDALGAVSLLAVLVAHAVLSAFVWWGPVLLSAAVAVVVYHGLRPTGSHRGSRSRRPVPASSAGRGGPLAVENAPAAVHAPTGGDTDTMPLAVVETPQASPGGVERADG